MFLPAGLDLFWIDYPGLRSRCVAWLGLFSLRPCRVWIVSLVEKQFPLRDAVGVTNQRGCRQLFRRARDIEQLQAGFLRQAVALLRVHGLARPHEGFPRVLAAARTRHDVVEAAFLLLQHLARVLA